MRRILFVDDEPHALEALGRLLRPYRKEWQPAFAGSGEEALALMDLGTPDVVVADMRMPNMDGAELLAAVRERFPNAIRIVLSGYGDAESVLRAAPVAHQFLTKPCDLGRLRDAIENASVLDQLLSDPRIRQTISSIGSLPALPGTCHALVQVLGSPGGGTAEEISEILSGDVGLTAKVLQLAGATASPGGEPITTVDAAVRSLGIRAFKRLLLCAELFESFPLPTCAPWFSLEHCQEHSRLVADIIGILPMSEHDRTYAEVAAYLHDVGKLVLGSRFAAELEAVRSRSRAEALPPHVIERELMGPTHAHVGAYLLALWGFPPAVVAAVARHHDPPNCVNAGASLDPPTAIQLADALAHHLDRSVTAHEPPGVRPDYLAGFWGVPKLGVWMEAAEQLVQERRSRAMTGRKR